jgi:hypothetical protein
MKEKWVYELEHLRLESRDRSVTKIMVVILAGINVRHLAVLKLAKMHI